MVYSQVESVLPTRNSVKKDLTKLFSLIHLVKIYGLGRSLDHVSSRVIYY